MQAIKKGVKSDSCDLDAFVSRQNIERYRKLLSESTDELQRRALIRLLADQMAKLRIA